MDQNQEMPELLRLDLENMVTNVDSLAVYARQSLQQTMGKRNTIDFETLNQGIEPLAKFVAKFKRYGKDLERIVWHHIQRIGRTWAEKSPIWLTRR